MKFLIISCLVAIALADVSHLKPHQGIDAAAPILKQESNVHSEGYQYSYETGNGISAQEQGQLKTLGDKAAIVVQGQNSYTSPDGQQISVQYTADEDGYHPQGSHLPGSSPFPEGKVNYVLAHPRPEKK